MLVSTTPASEIRSIYLQLPIGQNRIENWYGYLVPRYPTLMDVPHHTIMALRKTALHPAFAFRARLLRGYSMRDIALSIY